MATAACGIDLSDSGTSSGSAPKSSSNSSDSGTIVKGHHTLTYMVTADQGIDANVSVTYGNPLTHAISSDTITAVPWTKTFDGQDPDAAYARITVDNTNNDTPLHCEVLGDGTQSLVAKGVPAGQSVDCNVLHF